MFADTVTLFNFHEATGKWYPSVISGVDLQVDSASKASTPGTTDSEDTATLLIQSKRDKTVTVLAGTEAKTKRYLGPKAYAVCQDPEACITFKPECDFFFEGVWPGTDPVLDEDYDSGFYHEVNETHDGVHLVKSAAFLSLIPHFEIGGR